MKIKEINITKGNGLMNIFGSKGDNCISVYQNEGYLPKITFLLMPNTSGKSLVFNAMEHFLSLDTEGFIKDTDKDLEINISFVINDELFTFTSNFYNSFKVLKNGEEVSDFEVILRKEMGLREGRLEYYGSDRNSLHSISRFFFLNFNGIKEVETSNSIDLINSKYDGNSRRILFAYMLGAKIDNAHFKTITEVEHKESFIKKHEKKFEKLNEELQGALSINTSLDAQFLKLEEERILLGDISIAIKELGKLKNKYETIVGLRDQDFYFLLQEIEILNLKKDQISKNILNIRQDIQGSQILEKKSLGVKGKKDELDLFNQYNNFKNELKNIDLVILDQYIQKNIEPYILNFKSFLNEIYDLFVQNALEAGILTVANGLMPHGNIEFNEKLLKIEAYFTTSEGTRKAIRLLTFMALQIFSKNGLQNSFYDSCLENIDAKHRDVLFRTLFQFIELKNIPLQDMLFFVTSIDSNKEKDSLYGLSDQFPNYVNIIETGGLNDLKY